jgi:crotonobetainyl-CoA:carnitine CoA-transferase CaiB-like acyl-CoA transferase
VLAVGNDRQFAALCQVLGIPELAGDPRFADNPSRVANRAALLSMLQSKLSQRSAAEWSDRLLAARVPSGVVNDIAEAFRFAERIGLNPLVTLPQDGGSRVTLPRNPIQMSETPPSYRLPPPALS